MSFYFFGTLKLVAPLLLLFTSLCLCENQKTPEGVYAGCVGVSENYVKWHWKVEQCINTKCEQERRTYSVKYTRRLVTYKGSFAPQNKTYINTTTIYVKSTE